MKDRLIDWLDGRLYRRSLSRWTAAGRRAPMAELDRLKTQRVRARALRQALDRLLHVADSRLALPRIGSTTFPRPPGTDWSWRPQIWRGPLPDRGLVGVETRTEVGDEAKIFHDSPIAEITLTQLRNQSETDLAPFALRLEVYRFQGSFLSLVLDLPDEACQGLTRRHVVRLDTVLTSERPVEIFCRLNIRHGPNTEQAVQQMAIHDGVGLAEFDLAYTNLNEKRVEQMWVDVIFEGSAMNAITLRDVTLARHPRADL